MDTFFQFNPTIETPSPTERAFAQIFRHVFGELVVTEYQHRQNKYDINYEELVTKATRSNCHIAAAEVIKLLLDQYPQDFTHMLMLYSYVNPYRPFVVATWQFHCIVAIKDVSNQWYMGSPANYKKNIIPKYACGSFNECLGNIQAQVGGDWDFDEPSDLMSMWRPKYLNPDSKHTLRIPTIELSRGDQCSTYHHYIHTDCFD